jgi:hypothetical protein
MTTIVKNTLEPVIAARFIRIHPRSWQNHISMRVEFNGCFEGMFLQNYASSNFSKNHTLCLRIPNYKFKLFRRFSKQEPISGSVSFYILTYKHLKKLRIVCIFLVYPIEKMRRAVTYVCSYLSYPLSAGDTLGITKTHSQHA